MFVIKRKIKIIGLLIIFLGISICIYNYYENKKIVKINETKINQFFEEDQKDEILYQENNEVKNEIIQEQSIKKTYNYIAILEIPIINLKRGIVSFNSYYNNVNYNIQIINGSSMPNDKKGNLILAGHNGNDSISYFNKLDNLEINDDIYVYYNKNKYIYKLSNIYDVSKNGTAIIKRDKDKNTITLITCKRRTTDTQTIYIAYLDKVLSY